LLRREANKVFPTPPLPLIAIFIKVSAFGTIKAETFEKVLRL